MPWILRILGRFLMKGARDLAWAGISSLVFGDGTPNQSPPSHVPPNGVTVISAPAPVRILPAPPHIDVDAQIRAYAKQFTPVNEPLSPADIYPNAFFQGMVNNKNAAVRIKETLLRNDTLGFTFHIYCTDNTLEFDGKGYYLAKKGTIDFGASKWGFKQGNVAKIRHIESSEQFLFLYIPGKTSGQTMEFINYVPRT